MPAEKVAGTSNILFMMVDQMRADYMGCAGNPWIQTPGLDRLAAEGTRWVARLPDDERAVMESRGETVLNAIHKENSFTLEEINLKAFKENGGSLAGTPQQRLLDEIE